MAETRKNKAQGNDAYTALLGLAVLTLAATVGVVCYYGQILHNSIFFKVTGY